MEILTGNELASGATVYLDVNGKWGEDLQSARVFGPEDKAARDDAIARTKGTMRILSLEIERVAVKNGELIPERLRERIRATGSTTPVFDRQHLSENDHVSI
jgi:hypothetical protein